MTNSKSFFCKDTTAKTIYSTQGQQEKNYKKKKNEKAEYTLKNLLAEKCHYRKHNDFE